MGSSQVKPGTTYKLTQLHTGPQVKEIKATGKKNKSPAPRARTWAFILISYSFYFFDLMSCM